MTFRISTTFVLVMLAAPTFGEARAQRDAGAPIAAERPSGDSVFIPILVYHGVYPHHPGQTPEQIAYDVAPEAFEAQMTYLHDHNFHVASFAECVEALESGKALPDRTVVITFDDGRENQYVHAFPILKHFGYTATFFVYPNPVGRRAEFMTWDQIREMQVAGMTIGSHSYTHPYLTKIKDPRDMKREIEASRAKLEKELGIHVEYFAYPFGARNADIEAAVRKAGYRAARIFPGGAWNSKTALFSLKGVMVRDNLKAFQRTVERPAVAAAPAVNRPPRR
jgi:peptidoglycan/xylan/chitin deacetylase (PgdA/CDA1 family)